MLKSLSKIRVNTLCKVVSVDEKIKIKRRVFELGIVPNEIVKVLSISPLKNSFLIAVKNYSLALRKQIVDNIMVEEI